MHKLINCIIIKTKIFVVFSYCFESAYHLHILCIYVLYLNKPLQKLENTKKLSVIT